MGEQNRAIHGESRVINPSPVENQDSQRLRNQEAEIEQLRANLKDLVRLRNEVRQLREQNQELETLRQANAKLLQAVQSAGSTPSNRAALVASARKQGALLGISITGANSADPTGVVVQGIDPNSPAAQSDLKPMDVIIALDGRRVKTGSELQTEMLTKLPGQKVLLDVLRDGTVLRIEVETRAWAQ